MKAKITCNWLMKLVLRFTLEKLEKLSFKKIIPKFVDGNFRDFFHIVPKHNDRNRP